MLTSFGKNAQKEIKTLVKFIIGFVMKDKWQNGIIQYKRIRLKKKILLTLSLSIIGSIIGTVILIIFGII